MAIFIPRIIRVGYQKRQDTYTGFLAYVIYLDAKGNVRKETSWQNWRNEKIESNDYDNAPMDGFVLNKKVGGGNSGWNHRKTYCRVYDPRGFEFEIDMVNLLYILDNVSSIKGKGLDGKFVYAWEGSELFLMPVDAPDYAEYKDFSDTKFTAKKLRGADMILGATYRTKKSETAVYLGRYDLFENSNYGSKERGSNKGKHYFFAITDGRFKEFRAVSSVGPFVLNAIDETPAQNYAELMDKLEHSAMYSAFSHYEYWPISDEEYRDTLPYMAYTKLNGSWIGIRLLGTTRKVETWYNNNHLTWAEKQAVGKRLSMLIPDSTPKEDYCKYLNLHKKVGILENGNVEGGN